MSTSKRQQRPSLPAVPEQEFALARHWRVAKRSLTMQELAAVTGYSLSSIHWMEQGKSPPRVGSTRPRPVNPHAWQRYRCLCELIDWRDGRMRGKKEFSW